MSLLLYPAACLLCLTVFYAGYDAAVLLGGP
jgi:hypothetical protein